MSTVRENSVDNFNHKQKKKEQILKESSPMPLRTKTEQNFFQIMNDQKLKRL